MDDFDDDDMEALKSGSIQLLPEPDTAGRPVMFICGTRSKFKTWKNEIRNLWYQMMLSLHNDEEAQKRGTVGIFYYVGTTMDERPKDCSMTYSKSYLVRGVPVRGASCHFCLDDMAMHSIVKIACAIGGKDFRLRFRPHFGSHVECQYALKSFGIPQHAFPVNQLGEFTTSALERYISRQFEKERLQIEKEDMEVVIQEGNDEEAAASHGMDDKSGNVESKKKLIAVATFKDVLLGRGKPFQVHQGNLVLGELIAKYHHRYQVSNKKEKIQMCLDVIKEVQDAGGRFLKKNTDINPDMWEEVSLSLAREKVAHGFRTSTTLPLPPHTTSS